MRLSLSFPTTTLSSIWPPTPAVWFVDKWVGEVSVRAPRRERRSSLLLGIIAQRRGGTTLASEGEGRERGSRSQEGYARHDGKSNLLSGGRQGERLTDERDHGKTEKEEREHPKARQIRGGHHRKIMTMRGGGQWWRGAKAGGGDANTRSHTYHLKETFIPHIKGGSRDELS